MASYPCDVTEFMKGVFSKRQVCFTKASQVRWDADIVLRFL